MARKLSATKQKILLLLGIGLILGLSRSPRGYFKILDSATKEWQAINRRELYRAIKELYESKMIGLKENRNNTETMVILTSKGEKLILTFDIDNISIKPPKKWDGKWHIVLFDVPEKYRKGRDALRIALKRMGFYEYQKSVFVHPFECKNEIDFVIEYFQLRPWVRLVIAESLDNELHFKKHFGLI